MNEMKREEHLLLDMYCDADADSLVSSGGPNVKMSCRFGEAVF